MWAVIVFGCFLFSNVALIGAPDADTPITEETEEYDEKLSIFIREILENFRDQMPEGIPDIGIPPIDPLDIPDISEDINEGIAQLVLRMRNISIDGISQFEIETLKADLEKGFANFSVTLPDLVAEGYCYMNGKVLGIFPITSDGPFYIRVKEVKIEGYGDLNVTTGTQARLHMNDLKLHLLFGTLDIEFKSLLGGGKWTQTLVKLLSGLGRQIFLRFHREAMAALDKALLKLINSELDKGTLADLLDQIPMSEARQMHLNFVK